MESKGSEIERKSEREREYPRRTGKDAKRLANKKSIRLGVGKPIHEDLRDARRKVIPP